MYMYHSVGGTYQCMYDAAKAGALHFLGTTMNMVVSKINPLMMGSSDPLIRYDQIREDQWV